LLYITTQIGELWPKGFPWGAIIVKSVKNVTLLSYTVWRSAMKFGMVKGLANGHMVPNLVNFGWGSICHFVRR